MEETNQNKKKAVQGVLQALGYAVKPLVLSLLRLVVFVFPTAYLFTLTKDVTKTVWWTFLIAEALACVFAAIFLKQAIDKKIKAIDVGDDAVAVEEKMQEYSKNMSIEDKIDDDSTQIES